mgnify:CR=1 FL=1
MRNIPVLSLRNVTLSFGLTTLFKDLTIDISRFNKIALVGHNGSGKSTLLKVLKGDIMPDSGEKYKEPGSKIIYVEQEPYFEHEDITGEDFLKLQLENASLFYKAEKYIQALNANITSPLKSLSGGERRHISLISAFSKEPDILLMDEPTNHLDLSTIQWLEKELSTFRGAFVIISHDRRFLENTTNTTLWLERGNIYCLNKGFQHFYTWKNSILEKKVQNIYHLEKQIQKEQNWLHRGVTARRKRNQGRIKKLNQLRQERAELISQKKNGVWSPPTEVSKSKVIIEAFRISKSFDQKILIDDFSIRIMKGNRIGIIGANGTGKTTLLRLLTGSIKPDSGSIKIRKKIDIVYLDQQRNELKGEKSIKEILCPDGGDHIKIGANSQHVISYLKEFLFSPEQLNSRVSTLSGGEKNRLLLAKSLSLPSSVLILDEPTNDLDMDTLDMLQEMLDAYTGTILMVSHDRDFLDKTVTSIVAFEESGKLTEYAGGYSDFLLSSKKKEKKQVTTIPEPTLKKKKQPSQKKEKLSYNQVYKLNKIPVDLLNIEKKIVLREKKLSDTELYSKDPETFTTLTEELENFKKQKWLLEEEWLDLELLQEKLKTTKD